MPVLDSTDDASFLSDLCRVKVSGDHPPQVGWDLSIITLVIVYSTYLGITMIHTPLLIEPLSLKMPILASKCYLQEFPSF